MPAQAVIDRYRDLLLALLPPGDAFSRSPDSVFYDLCARMAIEFARVAERSDDLLSESVPSTVTELLDEWEVALGLPDTCFTPTTDDERRAAIIARIVGTGGHSVADYTALAASLGYEAPTFTTYAPFRMGSRMGDRFTNGPWRSAALVSMPSGPYDALVQCAFNHQKMAHETLLFDFNLFLMVDGDYVTVDGERVIL
jgi:uncharacterized protein YmfQ (DUF2313 family)